MTARTDLACLLAGQGPILLDFDGPVCSIFAGCPAPDVASRLRVMLEAKGIELTPEVANEPDPLEVLRWTGTHGARELIRSVEDALCEAELCAARSAAPTPYAREVIVTARQANRAVVIVSNNSAGAISEYLMRHRLGGHIGLIVGRAYAQPDRMKPNPEPVARAVRMLAVDPAACVFIGDSSSDILAGRAAGVPVIGYANKAMKAERFVEAGADVIVNSMADIARALMNAIPVAGGER